MVIVIAIVVVLALVVGAAWLVRRRGGDDTQSVEGYRNTLDTLQGMRTRPSTVRILGQDGGEAERPPPAGRDLVFEDPATRPPVAPPGPAGTSRRTQDRAISAMNHRPRRLAPFLVGAVVLVLLVVVIVLGARAHPHKPTTTTTTARHSTTTTAARHSTTTTTGHSTTTTTVPPSFTAITSTATSGTYVPPASSYTVDLTATSGQCWLTVKSSTGTSVFSQTLSPGQSKSLSLTGPSTIEVGAPSALTVTLDRKPVVLPTGYQTPFFITLQPAGGGTTQPAGGGTTTTTTAATGPTTTAG